MPVKYPPITPQLFREIVRAGIDTLHATEPIPVDKKMIHQELVFQMNIRDGTSAQQKDSMLQSICNSRSKIVQAPAVAPERSEGRKRIPRVEYLESLESSEGRRKSPAEIVQKQMLKEMQVHFQELELEPKTDMGPKTTHGPDLEAILRLAEQKSAEPEYKDLEFLNTDSTAPITNSQD